MKTNGLQLIVCIFFPPNNTTMTLTFLAVVDFYNHINLLYGSITEFCSPQSCPEMKATDEYIFPFIWRPIGTDNE